MDSFDPFISLGSIQLADFCDWIKSHKTIKNKAKEALRQNSPSWTGSYFGAVINAVMFDSTANKRVCQFITFHNAENQNTCCEGKKRGAQFPHKAPGMTGNPFLSHAITSLLIRGKHSCFKAKEKMKWRSTLAPRAAHTHAHSKDNYKMCTYRNALQD